MPNGSFANRIPKSLCDAQAENIGSRENSEPKWHWALGVSLKEAWNDKKESENV